MTKTEVLIVGGGFAGVKSALELSHDDHFKVTLLTEGLNFQYFPTLYHTVTGGKVAESVIPLKMIFTNSDVQLVTGTAVSLDKHARVVTTEAGQTLHYDMLLLALGDVVNYFGIKGLQEFAYTAKSIEGVMTLKHHLHQQLIDEHQPDMNYVIVGGGPTGIELAGALTIYIKQIMNNHGLKQRPTHIDLVEAAPLLLPRMPKRTAKAVTSHLRKLGIKLYLGKKVEGETADTLTVSGKPITSHTIIWTAGASTNPFFSKNGFALSPHGKVAVDVYSQADENVFVLGDNANTPYSGMAQTALHDAVFVSKNLKRKVRNKSLKPYRPKRPIYVIPAGPHWAAVVWRRWQIHGYSGWLLRQVADIRAFHDFEPWWETGKQFLQEFGSEESCPQCATHDIS